MNGKEFERPSQETIDVLRRGSTASITSILRRKGIENSWMDLKPLVPGAKIVGPGSHHPHRAGARRPGVAGPRRRHPLSAPPGGGH